MEQVRETDPTEADTDGDGIDDVDEFESEYDLDPTLADTDDDGIDDAEELQGITDPTTADMDGDGLDDGTEVSIGTDPLELDSDGDGFSDGYEIKQTEVIPGADPLRMDIYVEVDSTAGVTLPEDEAERVVEAFDQAPIEKNGREGINLHLIRNDTNLEYTEPSINPYRNNHFDYEGQGFHYAIILPEYEYAFLDVAYGGASPFGGSFAVQASETDDLTGETFMHELGHSLGLDSSTFDGIDSWNYSADEYRSVMNYNSQFSSEISYQYSSSEPFNDWEYINTSLHTPLNDDI